MADYTITAGNVITALTGKKSGTAGEAISAGQLLYVKAADGLLYLAQSDGTAAAEAVVVGMALNTAATGQPVFYQASGAITVGAVFAAAGKVLILSETAGKSCDAADATTGDYLTIVGYSTSTVAMVLDITATGLELA